MNSPRPQTDKSDRISEFFADTPLGKREEEHRKRMDDRDKDSALREITRMVSKSTPAMVSAAIGAAVGSFVVLKLEASPSGQTKWVPIPDWDVQAITSAVTIIAEAMSEGRSWNEVGFVMIQQRPPDVRALNTMLDRGFGKVAESVQINKNVTFSLADIGRRALAAKREMIRGEVVGEITDIEDTPLPSPQAKPNTRLTPTTW